VKTLQNFFSLVKFSHTVFALPFALAGYFMAISLPDYHFEWRIFIPVLLCMIFARTAAMAFNRWLDRNIDAVNPRTKNRDIPAGKISPAAGLMITIISSLLFIAATWFINTLCFYLSPVALFVILFYSYTKRFTWLCHWVLGTGLALAPTGAYIAVTGIFATGPVLLSFAVLFWVSGFDILYSIQDEKFDREKKLYSVPSLLGRKKSMILAAISHLFSVLTLSFLWIVMDYRLLFLTGIILYSLLLFLEHREIHNNGDKAIAPAFFNYNSWAGVLLCAGFIAGLYWI